MSGQVPMIGAASSTETAGVEVGLSAAGEAVEEGGGREGRPPPRPRPRQPRPREELRPR
jgi:hypothetical protein